MKRGVAVRALLILAAALAPLLLFIGAYVLYVAVGVRAGGQDAQGTVSGMGVIAPVRIVRDGRGFPHVSARNEHDLFCRGRIVCSNSTSTGVS